MDLKNLFKRKSKEQSGPAEEFSFDTPEPAALDTPGGSDDTFSAQAADPEGVPGDAFGFQTEDPSEEPGGGFGFQSGGLGEASDEFGYADEPRKYVEPTSFFGYFRKGVQLAMLKGDVAEEVAADEEAFGPALFIYLFPSFIIGLLMVGMIHLFAGMAGDGAAMGPQAMAMGFVKKFSFGIIPLLPLLALAGSVVYVGILHLVAKIFKGEGRFLDYYQTMGVGSLVSWGGIIPYLGFIFSIWSVVVCVIVTSRVHNLSTGKAVAVVLLPIVLFIALVIALAIMIPMMMMGRAGM